MAEIILYIAVSLDGFIATPDGGYDWLPTVDDNFGYEEFVGSVDAILMGSTTYGQILANEETWPYASKPTWVFSRQPASMATKAPNPSITVTAKSPTEIVAELETLGIKQAWLLGGAAIAAAFRAQGLITTYRLFIIPILLGAGIPLFPQPGPREKLTLVTAISHSGGVVELVYSSSPDSDG